MKQIGTNTLAALRGESYQSSHVWNKSRMTQKWRKHQREIALHEFRQQALVNRARWEEQKRERLATPRNV